MIIALLSAINNYELNKYNYSFSTIYTTQAEKVSVNQPLPY